MALKKKKGGGGGRGGPGSLGYSYKVFFTDI